MPRCPGQGQQSASFPAHSWMPALAGNKDGSKIGRMIVRLGGKRNDSLGVARAMFDIDRCRESSGLGDRRADFRKIGSDLDNDHRIGCTKMTGQSRTVECSWKDAQDIVAPGHRRLCRAPASRHAGHTWNDLDAEAILQPDIKMHEGPVEKRIALAYQSNIAAFGEMRRDGGCRLCVEAAQRRDIGWVAEVGFRRQGIEQRQLEACINKPAVEDGAGFSARALLGEIGNDWSGGNDFRGFDCHEIGITGAEADAVETAVLQGKSGHSDSLAIAFKAAAAMALPPLRPLMAMKGTRASAMSASFDSAAPTKPTGIPMTQAGRAEVSSSMSRR